eukprot:3861220-Pleurochrysis_carterae.AAC.1
MYRLYNSFSPVALLYPAVCVSTKKVLYSHLHRARGSLYNLAVQHLESGYRGLGGQFTAGPEYTTLYVEKVEKVTRSDPIRPDLTFGGD